jgi:hypothetical protein
VGVLIDLEALKGKLPKLYEHFQQGNFSDVVLQSWCLIELEFNQAILMSYGLSSQDVRSDPLLKLNFQRKLDLLKDADYIAGDEYDTLDKFRRMRNEIVHRIGGGLFMVDDSEKKEIMINAVQSALIAGLVSERVMNEKGRVVKLKKHKESKGVDYDLITW